jgi:tripeptide aminopeptidase
MKLLRIDEETTANVGSIHGGTSTNIVCDTRNSRHGDTKPARRKSGSTSGAFAAMLSRSGDRIRRNVRSDDRTTLLPLCTSGDGTADPGRADGMRKLGIPFVTKPTTGGSDANVFNRAGIPVAVLSAGYRNAPSVDETLDLEQLKRLAALTLDLATAGPRSNHHPKSN